jgi:type I restriction enzyme, S subunit
MTWPMVKLENLVSITSGFAFKSNLFSESEGVPLIRIRDVVRGETETFYTGEYSNEFIINNGDILIGMDGDFNRARWKGGRALLNQRVCRIKADESNLCDSYLYHFLPKALDSINEKTHAVTVKHLSVKGIRDIKIPLPPLTEQKRIAAILDKADAIRQKRQQAIALADQFLRSVFLDMFGDPVTNPKGFPQGTIRDLVESANYGSSAKASEDTGHYPMLRMGNITYQGRLDLSDLKFIDLHDSDKDKFLVRKGDLLFNRTNSKELVGKTAVFEEDNPMAFAGYLVRIRTNKLGNNYYLSGYLNSAHGKKTLSNMSKSIVGMANINAQELQNIRIPLPPIELQNRFESIVKETNHRLLKHEKSRCKLDILFASLSKKSFAGQL